MATTSSHCFALIPLFLTLLLSPPLSAAIIPRASTTGTAANPADSLLALVNSLDTSGAGLVGNVTTDLSVSHFTITQNAPDPFTRAAAIDVVRLSFLYGPPVAGGPYFPTGTLGTAKAAADQLGLQADGTPELTGAALDDTVATAHLPQVGRN